MQGVVSASSDQLREKVIEVARSHKASWIQLGQYLFTVHKDKMFKSWGFLTFEAYCVKDLGIKQATASKLLKSYAFLEKEEPSLTRQSEADESEPRSPRTIPDYESVNLLRLAKENESITPKEFSAIREAVFDNAKEPKEVRTQVKKILEEKEPEKTPEQIEEKKSGKLRRLLSLLKTASRDLEEEDAVPDYLLKQIQALIGKLEDQVRA